MKEWFNSPVKHLWWAMAVALIGCVLGGWDTGVLIIGSGYGALAWFSLPEQSRR